MPGGLSGKSVSVITGKNKKYMNDNSTIELSVSGGKIAVNRPEPITSSTGVAVFKSGIDPRIAVDALLDGDYLLVDDYYSSGLLLLRELKDTLEKNHSGSSFSGQRDLRSAYRELSNRILLLIRNHKIAVRKSPEIGWLEILYPELDEFLLPFPLVQGLNSSWQWYLKGISIPVLDKKIFPFFGTYFPTRFEHLLLFDQWLSRYSGDRKSAYDIGTGCGVLSYMMLKHGFEKIYATDTNPNAVYGVCGYIADNSLGAKIETGIGDLFAGFQCKTGLIVFNPPWIPASHDTDGLDKAIYYDDGLFPRFFEEAAERLEPGGSLVLLFSNLAKITGTATEHPVEVELASGGRFRKELLVRKQTGAASKKTRRDQSWRASEMVELWVLKALT